MTEETTAVKALALFPACCPVCGEDNFQENARRFTWQPLTFVADPEHGLVEGDYGSFDYADDVQIDSVECSGCGATWSSAASLERAMLAAAALDELQALLDETEVEIDPPAGYKLALHYLHRAAGRSGDEGKPDGLSLLPRERRFAEMLASSKVEPRIDTDHDDIVHADGREEARQDIGRSVAAVLRLENPEFDAPVFYERAGLGVGEARS